MSRREIINKTKEYVRSKLGKEATGHDWWHAFRVWKTAKYIARKEGGDLFIIEPPKESKSKPKVMKFSKK